MKFWQVTYNKDAGKYNLRNSDVLEIPSDALCVFKEFQMAYQYVCRMNNDAMQISRWARK